MKFRKILLIVLLAVATWVAVDLLIPVKTDIRQFDPEIVGHLDTEMWRSYYNRKPLKLYFQLGHLVRRQFHAPFWRSQVMAFRAARAAFIFKDGKEKKDYEKALPDLKKYYTFINQLSKEPFDANKAATLELEWWIVHRQRAQDDEGDLDKALAESAAAIYNVSPTILSEYAYYRAAAMDIRDQEAVKDGVSEEEWQQIEDLLQQSWNFLYSTLNYNN